MRAQADPVLIAGAGIGGLSLALALAGCGIASVILEREHELEAVGAGIQLSPNASHVLFNLGLESALRKVASEPLHVHIANGHSGRRLAELPLASRMVQRYGAPYLVVHRADLQQVLVDAAGAEPLITLRFGEAILGYDQDGDSVHVATASANYRGCALVGADGLRSNVRQALVGDGEPAFSGYVAWRGLADAAGFDPALLRATGLWLAAGAHLVHYPVRRGGMLNVVAIVEEAESAASSTPATLLSGKFAGWCPAARNIVAGVANWHRWPLFDRPPLGRWSDARVTLLGDAAHPMLPFMAQGGAMAIEDAAVLGACLGGERDVPGALKSYEMQRRARTARAQNEARANGRIYHLPAYLAVFRDMVLATRSSRALAKRQDWVFSWKSDQR